MIQPSAQLLPSCLHLQMARAPSVPKLGPLPKQRYRPAKPKAGLAACSALHPGGRGSAAAGAAARGAALQPGIQRGGGGARACSGSLFCAPCAARPHACRHQCTRQLHDSRATGLLQHPAHSLSSSDAWQASRRAPALCSCMRPAAMHPAQHAGTCSERKKKFFGCRC